VIVLKRFCYSPFGTFGVLHTPNGEFYTVECPWWDNGLFESCIPEGFYTAEKRPTTTPVPDSYEGQTWYLEGGTVGPHRTDIAIHIANTSGDVSGCIGLGTTLGSVKGRWAVLNSREAMEAFRVDRADKFSLRVTFAEAPQTLSAAR